MTIKVYDLVGQFAVSSEDGQLLYNALNPALVNDNQIILDFSKVRVVATPFLNAGVGQVIKDFTPDQFNDRVSFVHLIDAGAQMLRKVIENAKLYYHDPASREALDKILADSIEDH